MNNGKLGISMFPLLQSPESIEKFKDDPVGFIESAGGSVSHLDERSLELLRSYSVWGRLKGIGEKGIGVVTHPLKPAYDATKCTACRAALVSTVIGLTSAVTAVVALAIAATGGADAPAAPAEAVAGAAGEIAAITIELETMGAATEAGVAATTTSSLEGVAGWAVGNKVAAGLLVTSGAGMGVILGDICDALCKYAGACE